jgi:hypothetical protein
MGLLEQTEDRKGRWPTRRHLGQRRVERDDDLDYLAHNLAERVASARSGLLGPGDAAEHRRGDPVPAWRADHVLHMLEMGLQSDHGLVRHARRMEDIGRRGDASRGVRGAGRGDGRRGRSAVRDDPRAVPPGRLSGRDHPGPTALEASAESAEV